MYLCKSKMKYKTMSEEKFQDQYRIKSARATWHNYNSGSYFITVCTKDHKHSFGEIIVETGHAPSQSIDKLHANETGHAPSLPKQIMHLSPIGQYLSEKIINITNHCPYAEIPVFVVMPNHWHAIVFIDSDKTPYLRRNNVETEHAPSQSINEKMQTIDTCKGWLSVAIGGIKSAVTQFANNNKIDFTWQTRFHDHIICDQNQMNRIVNYIENNPETWDNDCFNENKKK